MPGTRRPGRPGDLRGIDPVVADGLEHLGLTAYEIRVYDAVLRHPNSRVPEIARASRVPQPKVYSTIKRLIERGLCQSHLGSINTYSVIDPDDAFQTLIDAAAERQQAAHSAVERLQSEFERSGDGKSRREGRVKLFQGKPAAGRAFRELMGSVEREVAIVVRFPLVVADYMDQVTRVRDAGGEIRMLCEVGDAPADDAREFCRMAREAGAKIRKLDHVPMRMGVFDQKILVLPMDDPAVEQGDPFMMLEVRNPELSRSFLEIYDLLWKTGRAR